MTASAGTAAACQQERNHPAMSPAAATRPAPQARSGDADPALAAETRSRAGGDRPVMSALAAGASYQERNHPAMSARAKSPAAATRPAPQARSGARDGPERSEWSGSRTAQAG